MLTMSESKEPVAWCHIRRYNENRLVRKSNGTPEANVTEK
jgi:hypothetical protein